jgi:hypothetical protein
MFFQTSMENWYAIAIKASTAMHPTTTAMFLDWRPDFAADGSDLTWSIGTAP